MKEEESIKQVAKVFLNMGAEEETARKMASQLVKRAEQKAQENKSDKIIVVTNLSLIGRIQGKEMTESDRLCA